MADYIDSQHENITVITVGGAVNTMLLQTRQTTHDVDFFGTNFNNTQRVLLNDAAKYAERRSLTPLGGEWFNNQTMLWLPPDVHRTVTKEALLQNEVVFEKRELKAIVAPWNYAFCGKTNRLVRPIRFVHMIWPMQPLIFGIVFARTEGRITRHASSAGARIIKRIPATT